MGRKARMRKLLREEDVEELQELLEADEPAAKAAPDGAKQPAAVEKALELQKAAGNRATGAVLQRWAGPMLAAAAPKWPKEPTLIVDGKPYPLASFSESAMSQPGIGGTGVGREKEDRFTGPGEVSVVIDMSDLAVGLYKAAQNLSEFKTVEVVLPGKDGTGIRFILTDVVVSGYQISSGSGGGRPHVVLQLQFKKREFAQTPPRAGGR